MSKPSQSQSGAIGHSDCLYRYAVAEWYEAGLCDREVAGSTPARGCCVPTPTQRAIPPGSVNE